MKQALIFMFERDLKKLKTELNAYSDEALIWKLAGGISNSTGTLVLHLVGNLNHFIGGVMGQSGYVRDRDAEFSLRGVPRQEMLDQIDTTLQVVKETLLLFPEGKFNDTYPHAVFGEPMTYEFFMLHLVSHLNYHLGQVNYHRRLLDV
jgi:hypothetical protein